eukprot:203609_1
MNKSKLLNPIVLDSIGSKSQSATPLQNQLYQHPQTIKTDHEICIENITESSPQLQHFIFLDYDDTLVPTTYLLSNIRYEANFQTNKITKYSLIGNEKEFIANLEKAGNAAFKFLNQIISKFTPENIRIVTNGVDGWVKESLIVAATLCKIYGQIANLIEYYKLDIFYARDKTIEIKYWKTKIYDDILLREIHCKRTYRNKHIMYNIVTIGDHWMDHMSMKQSFIYGI